MRRLLGCALALSWSCGEPEASQALDPSIAGAGGSGGAGGVAGIAAGSGGASGTSAAGIGGAAGMLPPVSGMAGIGGAAGDVASEAGMGGAGGMDVGGAGGMGGTGNDASNACLDGITTFDGPGPFTFKTETSGSILMWIPDLPAGCKVPMVHMANGTNTTCSFYQASLERLASHGFIALCFESPQTGAGTQAITAFDAALAAHADIADLKFGSTGHSQGGQSAVCALRLAEEKWGLDSNVRLAALAMQPASGFGEACSGGPWEMRYAQVVSPVFMFSGTSDYVVPQTWVQDGFNALSDTVEAYHWAKQDGVHLPAPNGEEMQLSIPWFRWKLLGDNEACQAFKRIRETDASWTEAAVQNEAPCL